MNKIDQLLSEIERLKSQLATYPENVSQNGQNCDVIKDLQLQELGQWSKRELDWRDNAITELQAKLATAIKTLEEIEPDIPPWGNSNIKGLVRATLAFLREDT